MKKPQSYPLILRILALVISLLIALVLSFYWLSDEPSQRDWDADRHNLPDIDSLQQRIQTDLFDEKNAPIESVGTDIDQIMDPEAMDAKLAGLTKNVTTLRQPTEQELVEFYQANLADYREASKFSFRQILFSRAKHGGQAYQKAQQALNEIAEGQMPLGDSSDLQDQYGLKSADKIDREFGNNFSAKLQQAVLDNQPNLPCWTGPITSNQGVHLVCIETAVLGRIPDLDSVRSQVINDWRYTVADN